MSYPHILLFFFFFHSHSSVASVGLPSRLEGRRGSSLDMTVTGIHAANATSPSKGSGWVVSTILTESKSARLPPSLTLFSHSAPSQPLFFSSSSFSAFTHPFFSVVNGQRWNQSSPALALRLSHQCKCQTAGVSPRDGWGLSELHTRALNNSVQALRMGTVTVCGP